MRTSNSHPIEIATVSADPGLGAIGVTFCPGKIDGQAMTGAWSRDLTTDLKAIGEWGAAAVVTLMETFELERLKVPDLGAKVRDTHMEWFHLPIRDVSVPDADFERDWVTTGAALRDVIRCGGNLLFHCRGGLGRSGMIAARMLVELGWRPDDAIESIRRARVGAIETDDQVSVVRNAAAIGARKIDTSKEATQDRARGALLGLAVGDAIGTTLEFCQRDSRPRLDDMIGGGPFGLKPGEWTDDTSMALALGDSLLEAGGLDEADLMDRFVTWREQGNYSCTGTCFDIGTTTRQALARYRRTGNPIAGSTDANSAGNGSLMRLAPVAIYFRGNSATLREVAERQSRATHAAAEAVDACAAFAELLVESIAGRRKDEVLAPRRRLCASQVADILGGRWRGKRRSEIKSSGYVVHSLEAALWCVARSTSFRQAVLLAANLGDDADTVAAITGQLAGALWGARGIPEPWLTQLAWRERITKMADDLHGH